MSNLIFCLASSTSSISLKVRSVIYLDTWSLWLITILIACISGSSFIVSLADHILCRNFLRLALIRALSEGSSNSTIHMSLFVVFLTPSNCFMHHLYCFSMGFVSQFSHNSHPYRTKVVRAASNTFLLMENGTSLFLFISDTNFKTWHILVGMKLYSCWGWPGISERAP